MLIGAAIRTGYSGQQGKQRQQQQTTLASIPCKVLDLDQT
jgi:hypothetical protein